MRSCLLWFYMVWFDALGAWQANRGVMGVDMLVDRVRSLQQFLCEGRYIDFAKLFGEETSFSCTTPGHELDDTSGHATMRFEVAELAEKWLSYTQDRKLLSSNIWEYEGLSEELGPGVRLLSAGFTYQAAAASFPTLLVVGSVVGEARFEPDGLISYAMLSQSIRLA